MSLFDAIGSMFGLGGDNPKTNFATPQIDMSKMQGALQQGQQARAQQQQAQKAAQGLADGTGPSAASAMLDTQSKNTQAQTNALAASGFGQQGQGQARRAALMAGAGAQAQLGGAAGVARAQEQLGGIGLAGGLAGQARGQDVQTGALQGQMAAEQANLEQGTNALNAGQQNAAAQRSDKQLSSVEGMVEGAAVASSPETKTGVMDAESGAGGGDNWRAKHAGLYLNPDQFSSPPAAKSNVMAADSGGSRAQLSPDFYEDVDNERFGRPKQIQAQEETIEAAPDAPQPAARPPLHQQMPTHEQTPEELMWHLNHVKAHVMKAMDDAANPSLLKQRGGDSEVSVTSPHGRTLLAADRMGDPGKDFRQTAEEGGGYVHAKGHDFPYASPKFRGSHDVAHPRNEPSSPQADEREQTAYLRAQEAPPLEAEDVRARRHADLLKSDEEEASRHARFADEDKATRFSSPPAAKTAIAGAEDDDSKSDSGSGVAAIGKMLGGSGGAMAALSSPPDAKTDVAPADAAPRERSGWSALGGAMAGARGEKMGNIAKEFQHTNNGTPVAGKGPIPAPARIGASPETPGVTNEEYYSRAPEGGAEIAPLPQHMESIINRRVDSEIGRPGQEHTPDMTPPGQTYAPEEYRQAFGGNPDRAAGRNPNGRAQMAQEDEAYSPTAYRDKRPNNAPVRPEQYAPSSREGAPDEGRAAEAVAPTPGGSDMVQEMQKAHLAKKGQTFAPMAGGDSTNLAPEEESKFRSWAKKNNIRDVDEPDSYYDYRGAYKAGVKPSANGHWPDTFKQHGHPTFSVESQYSKGPRDGGSWDGERFKETPGESPGATLRHKGDLSSETTRAYDRTKGKLSSPPQAKTGIKSEGGDIGGALRGLHPYSYNYKDSRNEPIPNPTGKERFFGVMTPDLKKHPVTRALVSGVGAGEKIAVPGATSFNLAANAHLKHGLDGHETRIAALEKMLKGKGKR